MVTNRIDSKVTWEAYKNFIADNKYEVAGNISIVAFSTIWELGFNTALASQAQQKTLKVSENWREPLSADAMQRLKNLGVLDKPLPPAPEAQQPHIVKSESYIREMLDAPRFHLPED